jgi:hypothetical protein
LKLKYEMSFWLIDLQVNVLVIVAFKRQLNIFSYIMARNSYDDEIRFVLTNTLSLIFFSASSLKEQSVDIHDILSWFSALIP